MESTCFKGCIQVSQDVAEVVGESPNLSAEFALVDNGNKEIKGKPGCLQIGAPAPNKSYEALHVLLKCS